jgi:hypothetical protein
MNYFLILIIMGLCGGGYYEYNDLQRAQKEALASDETQIANLKSVNQKLQAQADQLSLDDNQAQANVAGLSTQLKTTQADLAATKAKLAAAVPAAPATGTSGSGSVPGQPGSTSPFGSTTPAGDANNLGTITTADGKTFHDCQLLKVDKDGIIINHAEGITKILFGQLPPEMQKRFSAPAPM